MEENVNKLYVFLIIFLIPEDARIQGRAQRTFKRE